MVAEYEVTERARIAVRNGGALLDSAYGGWWREDDPDDDDRLPAIDLDRLDLSLIEDCVLGQLDGNYDSAMLEWFSGIDYEARAAVARALGFLSDVGNGLTPGELTEAWREYITGRRERGY
ncbi:MAG: hypothetical protein AB7Q01_08595 [Gammaproteobacteria bacterium]